jgi:arabinofuranan 3-O-arabinosyltransferase
LTLGEGFHDGWSASIDGESLGPAQLVDGGFNGWRIEPHEGDVVVDIAWTVQRPVTIALVLSAVAVAACIVLVVVDRRATIPPAPIAARFRVVGGRDPWLRCLVAAGCLAVGGALFVEPAYALWGLVGGLVVVATRRVRAAAAIAMLGLLVIAAAVLRVVVTQDPAPVPSFVWRFERLHRLGLFVAVALAVSALGGRRRSTEPDDGEEETAPATPAPAPALATGSSETPQDPQ